MAALPCCRGRHLKPACGGGAEGRLIWSALPCPSQELNGAYGQKPAGRAVPDHRTHAPSSCEERSGIRRPIKATYDLTGSRIGPVAQKIETTRPVPAGHHPATDTGGTAQLAAGSKFGREHDPHCGTHHSVVAAAGSPPFVPFLRDLELSSLAADRTARPDLSDQL